MASNFKINQTTSIYRCETITNRRTLNESHELCVCVCEHGPFSSDNSNNKTTSILMYTMWKIYLFVYYYLYTVSIRIVERKVLNVASTFIITLCVRVEYMYYYDWAISLSLLCCTVLCTINLFLVYE